jgi:hypothetical protein
MPVADGDHDATSLPRNLGHHANRRTAGGYASEGLPEGIPELRDLLLRRLTRRWAVSNRRSTGSSGMHRYRAWLLGIAIVTFANGQVFADCGSTSGENVGTILTPESSVQRPGDAGTRAHSNVHIYVPPQGRMPRPPPAELYDRPKSTDPSSPDGK